MLCSQIKELRTLANELDERERHMDAYVQAIREAADTIESLRDGLQAVSETCSIEWRGESYDTDASREAAKADDLACERYVLANGHVQLEAMANLDQVPATGAIIFVMWPHIEGATGMPVRAMAVCE